MKHPCSTLFKALSLFFLSIMGCVGDEPKPLTASIAVDVSKIDGPVNRLDFGENLEAADQSYENSDGKRQHWMEMADRTGVGLWDPREKRVVPDIAAEARSLGVGSLRYPGGCLVHKWDWRTCVGPIAERGKGTAIPLGEWTFGMDEYLQACKEIGAEPIIECSDYILPAEEMPRHLAQLVEYLNAPATKEHPWAMKRAEWGHPEPYGVKWFELGNESWHGNHAMYPRRQFSPEDYAKYAVDSARAMRAVDPSIKLGIVLWNEGDTDWIHTILTLAGGAADFVIFHIYLPNSSDSTLLPSSDGNLMQAAMAAGGQVQYKIDEFHRLIKKECGHDLPVAITEYNAGFMQKTPEYRYSFAAALESADMLRIFLQPKNKVEVADYFNFLNGYFGLLKSDPYHPENPKVQERPAATLFKLWGSHFGKQLVDVKVQGPTGTYDGANPGICKEEGSTFRPAQLIHTENLASAVDFSKLGNDRITGQVRPDGTIELRFDQYLGYVQPFMGSIPTEQNTGAKHYYRLSYEGRLLLTEGEKPSAMNLVASDAKGSDAGLFSAQFLGIRDPEWHSFSRSHPSTLPGDLAIYGRFHALSPISGRLEIRNLKLETYSSPILPAYPLITASSSLSGDGKTLYLIVFNKTDTNAVQTEIHLKGFDGVSAKMWQVDGPKLDATTGIKETVSGASVPIAGKKIALNLPAHTMTALEIGR